MYSFSAKALVRWCSAAGNPICAQLRNYSCMTMTEHSDRNSVMGHADRERRRMFSKCSDGARRHACPLLARSKSTAALSLRVWREHFLLTRVRSWL